MGTLRVDQSARPPAVVGYSLVLGLAFTAALMGFAAVRARDGRMPIADWLDPLMAGATLLVMLGALAALVLAWPQLPATRLRTGSAVILIAAEWTYLAGEIISNAITVGEPPSDLGSLLEFAAGGATVVGLIVIAAAVSGPARRHHRTAAVTVTVVAAILTCAMIWWFTHPIDQSTPGTPGCIPGNALYNAFRGTSC
jgi:hypothetical protein